MTIACPDCGTIQLLRTPPPRASAHCARCEAVFERRAGRSVTAGLALAAATFILLIPANALPFVTVGMAGTTHESRLSSGVATLLSERWVLLALGVAAFGVVLPILRFGLLTASLGATRLGRRPPWIGPAFRWATELTPWSMPDVFVIGYAIGFSRLATHLSPQIGAGGWCFLAAAFLSMITDAALDKRTVWRTIGPSERRRAVSRRHRARPAILCCRSLRTGGAARDVARG